MRHGWMSTRNVKSKVTKENPIALKMKKGKVTIKLSSSSEKEWDDAETNQLVNGFKTFKSKEAQKFMHNKQRQFNKKINRKTKTKIHIITLVLFVINVESLDTSARNASWSRKMLKVRRSTTYCVEKRYWV